MLEPLRVVVVHWNQARECVATVERLRSLELPVRVTVVDNGSRPDELSELRAGIAELGTGSTTGSAPRPDGSPVDPTQAETGPTAHGEVPPRPPPEAVELVEVGQNSGFGPGANVGLRRFLDRPDDGDWVALCPHDVEPERGCLSAMLEAAGSELMAGLLCADVGDGMSPVIDPYFGGMVVPAPEDPRPLPRWEDVDYPHGTLMLLRRQCLAEIGVFDERYFSYCEEADLALRAKRAGWRIGLIRGARVRNVHLGSSVALVDYLQTRNTLLLVQELSGWYHVTIRAIITILQTIRGSFGPAHRPLVFDRRARLLGLRDFVLRRFGPPPTFSEQTPRP